MSTPKGATSILEGWQTYERILPPNCSDVQRWETEQAFYAGAAAMFEAMENASADPGPEATDGDLARVSAIYQELVDFSKKQAERLAKRRSS